MATTFRCVPRSSAGIHLSVESAPPIVPEMPDGVSAIALAGAGTFSEVWQVLDSRTQQLCALKRLRSERRNDASARRLLANEARTAAAVDSPHVVRLIDSQVESPSCCIVFEWLDGITLEQRLSLDAALAPGTAVWIARQCAQAVADMALAGFAHGDIKPANIMLTSAGHVKLVDLGFARPVMERREAASARLFTGTAEYMAPESMSPQASNPIAKDIYSLGITLFRMLTGCLPFTGNTTVETLRLQRTARPPELRRKCPSAPRELANLVDRMLAKQPIRRPNNPADLVRSLIEIELMFFPQRLAG